jgi:hypothetical protein
VHDDPLYGREVLARFTDGTQLSICIAATQSVEARYCREDTPDLTIFVRQEWRGPDADECSWRRFQCQMPTA